ncbi:MAG: IS982 family transposase, partial [Pseudomonadota bacterium]
EEFMLAPVTEIFCEIDDFCKLFYDNQSVLYLPKPDCVGHSRRESTLSISEIITIQILFQLSHYRTFKDFYDGCLLRELRGYFPKFISYNRFTAIQSSVIPLLLAFMLTKTGKQTGIYYIDATALKVCNNRRIHSHKVFKDIAKRGKTSMGWFFGFKLHLVVNHLGKIMAFQLTAGNVDDRVPVKELLKNLIGMAAGDRGYIKKGLAEYLQKFGLNFLTKIKKNMKEKIFSPFEKMVLKGRGIIKTIFDQLKAICQIEHTRHRKPDNFIANLLSGLIAYTLRPRKPKILQKHLNSSMKFIQS